MDSELSEERKWGLLFPIKGNRASSLDMGIYCVLSSCLLLIDNLCLIVIWCISCLIKSSLMPSSSNSSVIASRYYNLSDCLALCFDFIKLNTHKSTNKDSYQLQWYKMMHYCMHIINMKEIFCFFFLSFCLLN